MAQETVRSAKRDVTSAVYAKNFGVAVLQASNSTILEVDNLADLTRLNVSVTPGGQAFDAFIIQAKMHADDTYQTLYSAAADFTSPAGLMVDASGDLTALAAATAGWFVMDIQGIWGIKILASVAVGDDDCDIYATFS